MEFSFQPGGPDTLETSLLVVFSFEGEKAAVAEKLGLPAKALADFTGKFRSCLLAYPSGTAKAERVLLLGLGKKLKLTAEEIRRAGALAVHKAKEQGVARFALAWDRGIEKLVEPFAAGAALAEGLVLGAYSFDRFKSKKEDEDKEKKKEIAAIDLFAVSAAAQKGFAWGRTGAESQCYVRDLANLPSNEKYPRMFAQWAAQLIKGDTRMSCKVFEEGELKKLGMGAFLGVNRGSDEPPRLVLLHYKPRGKKGKRFCVVGKGITFDSGGISLKPSASMDEMKYDMSGGAAVFGLFRAMKELDLPHEIVGLVPFTENLPGGNAQKPGDIVTAFNGVTIEVLNTDAEGRLVLADALSYAVKEYEPDAIFDIATLTGAVAHALGHELHGVLGNDEKLIAAILESGKRTGEEGWHLPMLDAHKEAMKSQVADLKNISSPGVGAGASVAAGFLSHFVGNTPWIHLDIAGAAWGGKDRDYYKRGSAGLGVRLLLDFLRHRR